MTEKVSVIIPTYNREKTILRALQSVLDQTYTNLEVLVIDDGSTDSTADIVNSISDERVKYIVLEKNGGPSNARNVGVQLAGGEWIAFQDSDDSWHKDKLEVQMAYAKEHPEYAMIYCMYNMNFKDGRTIVVPSKPLPEVMEGDVLKTLLVKNVVGAPTVLIKKKDFLTVGGFDTSYKALEDWEFALRFAMIYKIGFVQEPLMDCYMLTNGVSSNIGAYFEARCKMMGQYRTGLMQEGILESVMQDILVRAQQEGVLEVVKNLMMIYLSR